MLNDFFASPDNRPFLVALGMMIALCILAVVASLAGFASDADVDAEIDTPAETAFEWLGVTAMPSSVFVILATLSFFLVGFITQWIAYSTQGRFLSGWIAIVPALLATIATMRLTGLVFRKLKIKVDSSAVHSDSFVGKIARISGGTARAGLPAQAKFMDEFGQVHYVLVEPIRPQDTFSEGEEVSLLARRGPKFFVVTADPRVLQEIDIESLTVALSEK